MTYSVYCFRFKDSPIRIESGLSLQQAQVICKDPQTSSMTSTDVKLMKRFGPDHWFFGYEEDSK
jgi:hypothetical protein